MKLKLLTLCGCMIMSLEAPLAAQEKKQAAPQQVQSYPERFSISQQDLQTLFQTKTGTRSTFKENRYLNNGSMELNTLNGDMHFLNYKLSFFKNARLIVQKNGEYTTQVFVTSDDKSVFYKGTFNAGQVTLVKCEEDEIVSE